LFSGSGFWILYITTASSVIFLFANKHRSGPWGGIAHGHFKLGFIRGSTQREKTQQCRTRRGRIHMSFFSLGSHYSIRTLLFFVCQAVYLVTTVMKIPNPTRNLSDALRKGLMSLFLYPGKNTLDWIMMECNYGYTGLGTTYSPSSACGFGHEQALLPVEHACMLTTISTTEFLDGRNHTDDTNRYLFRGSKLRTVLIVSRPA